MGLSEKLEKTENLVKLRREVKSKPQLHWVYEIRKHVTDVTIANWVASVIWWNSANPRGKGELFEMTKDYRPSKARGRDFELNQALNKLGLPSL